VPKEGFEPSWKFIHYALNVARLPVPPLRLSWAIFLLTQCILNGFLYLSTFFYFLLDFSISVSLTML
jgi:hypothetical protein